MAQSCLTPCDPMDCSTPGFPVLHYLPESAQIHVHCVDDAIHPSHPLPSLLLLPSILPGIRIFSSELALHIRWPKYWSFGFSIGPSSKCSGLISFRNDWFDLLAVQATLESLLQAELNIWNGAIQPVLMCALLVVDHKIQTFYPMVQLWLNIQVRPAHVQSIRLFVDLLYLWKRWFLPNQILLLQKQSKSYLQYSCCQQKKRECLWRITASTLIYPV